LIPTSIFEKDFPRIIPAKPNKNDTSISPLHSPLPVAAVYGIGLPEYCQAELPPCNSAVYLDNTTTIK
jgi:hypothetical protein